MASQRSHGGPDAQGVPRFDFSTNSNACGPCPMALAAVQQADATRYPDPTYQALRECLASLHGVAPGRVLLAASASEFIHRISVWAAQTCRTVGLPPHHYGDYAHAAHAAKLTQTERPAQAGLLWACEPSSPLGQAQTGLAELVSGVTPDQQVVLDCAYAPLRLSGEPSLSESLQNRVWQLWTPNKALGLTGVRAAYVIAPEADAGTVIGELEGLAPSWPLGAHGVALLQAWCDPVAQGWLCDSLALLRVWKTRQIALCESLGWICLPSEANYFCARVDGCDLPGRVIRWREQGIKLRDAASFGLPGHVRLGVLAPAAQDALVAGFRRFGAGL